MPSHGNSGQMLTNVGVPQQAMMMQQQQQQHPQQQQQAPGHPTMAFNSNMASRVTLACCQSLCDVLSELPLPKAVSEKTQHTKTLVTGGLSNARNGLLEDFRLVPHLRAALYMAKQQLADLQLNPESSTNNSGSTPGYGNTINNGSGLIVSPGGSSNESNHQPPQPPSQLLLRLNSEGIFGTPTSAFLHHANATGNTSQGSSVASGSTHSTGGNNLSDLHADLHGIEPSIDKHMTDMHPNLMNDLINDDCDMSTTMTGHNSAGTPGANDIYSGGQPQHDGHHQQSHLHSAHQQQMQHPHHSSHHQPHPSNQHHQSQQEQNAYQNQNAHNQYNNNNDFKGEEDDYSSLGERVKARQREAAAKAQQNQQQQQPLMNQNSQQFQQSHHQVPQAQYQQQQQQQQQFTSIELQQQQQPQPQITVAATVNNRVKSESSDDKEWKIPMGPPAPNRKPKAEPAVPRKSASAAFRERLLAERKPPVAKSIKYQYSDFDSSDRSDAFLTSSEDIVERFEQMIDEILTSCNDANEFDEEEDDGSDNDGYYDPLNPGGHSKRKRKRPHKSHESNHVNGGMISFNVNMTPEQIKEITVLSARLKQTNRVVEIDRKKIILFLTVLSNQLNLWFTHYKSKAAMSSTYDDEGEVDPSDEAEKRHFWQLCCNASQSALHIMTSTAPNNDKASLISLEELIEFIVDFLSNNLSSTTHVSTSSSKSKKSTIHHLGVSKVQVSKWTQLLQLLFEFVTLRSKGSLTDTLILSLTRISMNALFLLQNTVEMQTVAIEMLCHVFEEYPRHRLSIIEELMHSLAKIPTKKSHRKDSVLTQMLIRLTNAFYIDENNNSSDQQQLTRESLKKQSDSALTTITGFLTQFLAKCYTPSGAGSADVDFKLIFEALLNDLLEQLHSPYHTSAILIVQVIVKLLISFLAPQQQSKGKSSTLSQRLVAIEYLSIICSKFAQLLAEKSETITELEKTLNAIEESEKQPPPTTEKRKRKDKKDKDKDKATPTTTDQNAKVEKIWTLLVNYFNSEKLYREKLVLASVWIREKEFGENEPAEENFLATLNKKKVEFDNESEESVIDVSTASLFILYMEFVRFGTNQRLFEVAIKHLTASLSNTSNTTQRSRAMKCLSAILSSSSIESASQLLQRNDLQNAMKSALLDPSTSVREATVDLIGRFVLQSRDIKLCQRYCDLICERVLDTGISVRKRVIKILRDFCIEFPEFEKCGEMACKIVKRINDDGEGIRRLVVETCRDLWFVNTGSNQTHIKYKVFSLLHVIKTIINDNQGLESMQSLFDQLVKEDTLPIAQEICDYIMGELLIDLTQTSKIIQVSAIQCVSMLCQCSPPLMVKHLDTLQSLLSLTCETVLDFSMRTRTINTIERVLPHVHNPSTQLLTRLEEDMTKNILQAPATVIQCSIKCLSVLLKNHTKNMKLAVDLFKKFQKILYTCRKMLLEGSKEDTVKPRLLRAIFTCGLFMKYFAHAIPDFKIGLRDTLIELITSRYSVDIKSRAIIALGFVIESDPRICLMPEVTEIYTNILQGNFAPAKDNEQYCIQVLNNFRSYLSESIESDEEAVKTIQWAQESLKTMASNEDDSGSTQSQIIQKYLSSILINALNPSNAIRRVAGNVIHVVHSGGHVHPLQLVPHLVAMTSDDDQTIRVRADHVLSEIERKYHGYVTMKHKEAILLTGIFCKKLGCPGYRVYMEKTTNVNGNANGNEGPSSGALSVTREVCARLSTLYQVICTNRQSRRGFVNTLLRSLDISDLVPKAPGRINEQNSVLTGGSCISGDADEVSESTNAMGEKPDVTYFVENILFFPYTVTDEILYILTTLECTNSINSTHMGSMFKDIFIFDKVTYIQDRSAQQQQQQKQQHQLHQMNQLNAGYGQAPMLLNQYAYPQQQQPMVDAYGNFINPGYQDMSTGQYNQPINNMYSAGAPMGENAAVSSQNIDDLDLDNEENFKKYENYIHVDFDLLMNEPAKINRLGITWKILHTIYLSNLMRTLLKEFYLLKEDKISEYSTTDAKTWEKAVHRRQVSV